MECAPNGRRMFRHAQYLILLPKQTISAKEGGRAAQRILAEPRAQLVFAQVFRCGPQAVGTFDAEPPDRQGMDRVAPMRHPDLPQLTAADLDRLAAIVVLLSSDKPGEVVATEADAQRLLARHGLTSRILVAAPDVFPDWPTRWRSALYLRRSAPPPCLAPFQRQFVANLSKDKYKPPGPQLDILATIVGNVIAKGDAQ